MAASLVEYNSLRERERASQRFVSIRSNRATHLSAIDDDSTFSDPTHSARQYACFDISANSDQISRTLRMRDAIYVLLNDGSFV